MKNLKISDLAPLFEKLDAVKSENKQKENEIKSELFKSYDSLKELIELKKNAENIERGDYTFNNHGDFCYQIEIESEIASLPFIDDYLSDDSPCWVDLKNKVLEVNLCGPITVSFSHNKNAYFVYDHDTHKPVIESFKNDCYESEELARLMIEKYQRDSGCFGDVVEIGSYYGEYLNHLSSDYGRLSDEEFKTLYDKTLAKIQSENEEN